MHFPLIFVTFLSHATLSMKNIFDSSATVYWSFSKWRMVCIVASRIQSFLYLPQCLQNTFWVYVLSGRCDFKTDGKWSGVTYAYFVFWKVIQSFQQQWVLSHFLLSFPVCAPSSSATKLFKHWNQTVEINFEIIYFSSYVYVTVLRNNNSFHFGLNSMEEFNFQYLNIVIFAN